MLRSILLGMACAAAAGSLGCSGSDDTTTTAAGATGAGGTGTGGSGGGGALEACPKQHDATTGDGHAVVVCDELHAEQPYVRPPADDASASFVATDGHRLFVRGEPPRELSTEELDLMGIAITADGLDVRRYAYAIYRMTFDTSGAVATSAPAVLIEDAPVLDLLAGKTVEGLISRHKADLADPNFEYEQTPTLALRIHVGEAEPIADGDDDIIHRAALPLAIENLDAPALASTSECLPALSAAGAENPFDGQAPLVLQGSRVPAMHGPGDNELVIDGGVLNHMSPGWMVLPHQLFSSDPIELAAAEFGGHGNPLSMPRFTLAFVTGGGGACVP